MQTFSKMLLLAVPPSRLLDLHGNKSLGNKIRKVWKINSEVVTYAAQTIQEKASWGHSSIFTTRYRIYYIYMDIKRGWSEQAQI